MGFLNAHTEIDRGVLAGIVGEPVLPLDLRPGGRRVHGHRQGVARRCARMPGLDTVLTAGSARGVADGLDDLVARARADEQARDLIMAGGDLLPEHIPWLVMAGVRAFQIGPAARPLGSTKAYVDADLVGTWRTLIDDAVRRAPPAMTVWSTRRPGRVTAGSGRTWSATSPSTSCTPSPPLWTSRAGPSTVTTTT